MPLYEYQCGTCGTTFEQLQRFGEAPVQQCPRGHAQVRRVYTPVGIIFKGSGFYTTDYRTSSDHNRRSSDTGHQEEKE